VPRRGKPFPRKKRKRFGSGKKRIIVENRARRKKMAGLRGISPAGGAAFLRGAIAREASSSREIAVGGRVHRVRDRRRSSGAYLNLQLRATLM